MINLDQRPMQRRPGPAPAGSGKAPQSPGQGGPGNAVLFQPAVVQNQPPMPGGAAPPGGPPPPQQQQQQKQPVAGKQPSGQGKQQAANPVIQQLQADAAKLAELNSIIAEQEERLASLRRYIGKPAGQPDAAGQANGGMPQSQYGQAFQNRG